MAAMAARTVSKRVMSFEVGNIVSKILAGMQEDDYSSSLQLHEGGQAKPSKKKGSHGDR
jgi:DNA gyrase/topoisomerase IV subunit B